MKNYYQILSVSPSASSLEIKRAYRKLAIQYHPDKNPDPSAEALFKEINEAYDVLSDPAKKSKYDWKGQNPWAEILQEPPPPQHRDPAYRKKRPANYKSDTQRMREFMGEYLQHTLWICRVGLIMTSLFALDYVLPYRSKTEKVVEQNYVSGRRGYGHLEIVTESGRKIKVYDGTVGENGIVDYELTLVYSTVMSITHNGQKQTLGRIYSGLAIFPVVIFIGSLVGILYRRKSTETAFNAGVSTGLLLLIFLYLLF